MAAPRRSALHDMIRIHYKMVDRDQGPWTETRVRDLCNSLQLTEEELAAFLRVSRKNLSTCAYTGQFPAWLRLMLSLLEGWVKRTRLGDSEVQIFPTHLL